MAIDLTLPCLLLKAGSGAPVSLGAMQVLARPVSSKHMRRVSISRQYQQQKGLYQQLHLTNVDNKVWTLLDLSLVGNFVRLLVLS